LAALAEIDPTTYSRIERGERDATFEQRLALARVLGIEPETIFQRVTA
jgi:transcriptional regulator with XRE-family HTH domain